MRKINFLNSQNIDVLIIDTIGSEYVKHCIPNHASFTILPVRNNLPIIASFGFLFRLLSHMINLKRLRYAIFFSIIETLKPRVIISFIDNSDDMGILHSQFPDKLTISIQGGFRSGFNYSEVTYSKHPVSIYYGFGVYGQKVLQDGNVNMGEYVSAGSLKFGLFKKQVTIKHDQISASLHYFHKDLKTLNLTERKRLVELIKGPVKLEKKYDICLISEFCKNDDSENIMLLEQQEKVFLSLIRICKKFDFSLCVSLRYEAIHLSDEINYFSEIDTERIAELIPNNYPFFVAYRVSSNSNVIVSGNSTLAFEMFGAGKKTLFGASAYNFSLARKWDLLGNFNKFPDMNLLDDFNDDSLYQKINFLLKIDDNDYLNQTKKARIQYMNHVDKKPVDELIENRINDFLLNV